MPGGQCDRSFSVGRTRKSFFLRAGKVSMRANCVSLLTCSLGVMRTRPRLSDVSHEVRGVAEQQPARKRKRCSHANAPTTE